MSTRLGFIGSGVMASALMSGLIRTGVYSPDQIIASDPFQHHKEKLDAFKVHQTALNTDVVEASDVIIIAVKPHIVLPVLRDLALKLSEETFQRKSFISIAAGVCLEDMESCIPSARSFIRVMPNTPCLVGECAAAYAIGSRVSEEEKRITEKIFSAVGTISLVAERLLDAVTGLSGSGPAYVFLLIEALADGGVRAGLPRAVAMQLATQTVKGAASMVQETGLHPGLLKDQVCSPGGTTIAGVEALEENGFRNAAIKAVVAASLRAGELRNNAK